MPFVCLLEGVCGHQRNRHAAVAFLGSGLIYGAYPRPRTLCSVAMAFRLTYRRQCRHLPRVGWCQMMLDDVRWLDASHVGGKHGRSGSSARELGLGAGRHVHHVSIVKHAFKWFSANGIGQKPFNQVINSECWVSSRQDRKHCVSSESASTKPKKTLLPGAPISPIILFTQKVMCMEEMYI